MSWMKRFEYMGANREGAPVSGTINALNVHSAESKLRLKGYIILTIAELPEEAKTLAPPPVEDKTLPPPPRKQKKSTPESFSGLRPAVARRVPPPPIEPSALEDPPSPDRPQEFPARQPVAERAPRPLPPPPPLEPAPTEKAPARVEAEGFPARQPVAERSPRPLPPPPPLEPAPTEEAPARVEADGIPTRQPVAERSPRPLPTPPARSSKPARPVAAPEQAARTRKMKTDVRKTAGPGRIELRTPTTTGTVSQRVKARPYQPRWWQRPRLWNLSGKKARRATHLVFLCLALAGLVALVVVNNSSGAESVPEPILQLVELKVQGRLHLPAAVDPATTRLAIRLPEIPLEIERTAEALGLGPKGEFRVEISFESRQAPTRCEVSVQGPDFKAIQLADLPLVGDPPVCEVGDLELGEL